MRVRVLIAIVVGVVAVFAGVAHAKGPSGGKITGEGIATSMSVGSGEGGPLVDELGFFAAAFGQEPNPMLDAAPPGDLGTRFTVSWQLPGPDGGTDVVTQSVYPYADAGPVVHTAPGQAFYGSETTRGGWYLAPARLVSRLQAIGVPARDALETTARSTSASSAAASKESTEAADLPLLPIGATLGLVSVAAAALVLIVRRRHAMVPTTT